MPLAFVSRRRRSQRAEAPRPTARAEHQDVGDPVAERVGRGTDRDGRNASRDIREIHRSLWAVSDPRISTVERYALAVGEELAHRKVPAEKASTSAAPRH